MNSRTILTAGLVTFIAAGCGTGLYIPTATDATFETSLDELVEGRQLYVTTCGSCHSLYAPTRFTEQTWKENLDEMQSRAKLTERDKAFILKYLIVGRQRKE